MLLRCESLEPRMSQRGQTRSFGDVSSRVRFARKRTRLHDDGDRGTTSRPMRRADARRGRPMSVAPADRGPATPVPTHLGRVDRCVSLSRGNGRGGKSALSPCYASPRPC